MGTLYGGGVGRSLGHGRAYGFRSGSGSGRGNDTHRERERDRDRERERLRSSDPRLHQAGETPALRLISALCSAGVSPAQRPQTIGEEGFCKRLGFVRNAWPTGSWCLYKTVPGTPDGAPFSACPGAVSDTATATARVSLNSGALALDGVSLLGLPHS